jgi:hypothetical protein
VKTIRKDELYRGFFELFTSCYFSPPLYLKTKTKVKLFRHRFFLFVHGRVMLAMEGKSVLPTHIGPFLIKKEVYLKVSKGAYIKYV